MDKTRRPSKRNSMKENIKFPYKKLKRIQGNKSINFTEKYALVDKDGKVVKRFRLKMAARSYKSAAHKFCDYYEIEEMEE